jgi:hypothetical protein
VETDATHPSGGFQSTDKAQLISIATTEQYILTMNRSNTMSDLSQRASMFFTSVSSALVALALVAQATKFGETFLIVSCVIFATLYLLGLQTYIRSIQQSIEDMHLACGVNRIRHLYIELVPASGPYFLSSVHDDYHGLLADMGLRPHWYQRWITTASSISLVEAALGGAVAGITALIFFHATMFSTIVAAFAAFGVSLLLLKSLAAAVRAQSLGHVPMFPSPTVPATGESGDFISTVTPPK